MNNKTKDFGMIIIVFYVVFAVILLTNVLIASMSDTYQSVTESKRKQWMYARAQYIYKLDISMFASIRRKTLTESSYMAVVRQSDNNNDNDSTAVNSYIFQYVHLHNNALKG